MARKKKQTTDLPPENVDNTDDTFGLPEVEYEPLKRDEPVKPDDPVSDAPDVVIINEAPVTPEPPVEHPSFKYQDPEPVHEEEEHKEKEFVERHEFIEEDSNAYRPSYTYKNDTPEIWPKVLGIILVLLLVGAGVWYLAYYRPKQVAQDEKERRELLAIQEDARRKEDARLAEAKRLEEVETVPVAPPAPAIGAIETLSGRSGRYYVVIASSIDGDLIMDYAKKLSSKGVSTKIIPPFGKSKFHRLAVADGDTYETTQTSANELKGGEYGNKVWVVKY